jgi:hypothetical protein
MMRFLLVLALLVTVVQFSKAQAPPPASHGGNTITLATTAAGCPESFSLCVKAGAYYLIVGPDFDDGSLACGQGSKNEYSLKVTGAPASCPSTLDTTCSAPGRWLSERHRHRHQ